LKYSNTHNLPAHVVEAIVKNTYDVARDDSSIISMTQLINPPRIRSLSVRHWAELEEDVADNLWRLFGNTIHAVMERIDQHNRFIEERLKEPIMGITVVGRPDLYEDEVINDYKFTSVWAVNKEKIEWVNQINGYAWFFRKMGFKVEKGFINAFLRDWRKSEAKKYKSYPKIPFKLLPIEIWDFKTQDEYIHDRIAEHVNADKETDKNLPLCTPEERWDDKRCKDYCAVAPFCTYWQKKYGNPVHAENPALEEL